MSSPTPTSTSRRCGRASASRLARGHRGARQGRLARSARLWQRLDERRGAHAARLAVDPGQTRRARARPSASAPGFGNDRAHARLPQGLHGRDARLADRVAARRQRRADHERRGARRDRAPRRRRGVSRRGPRDRRSREPRGARRVRADRRIWQPLGLRQRIEHAQLLAPEDLGRFAAIGVAASVQFSHAPSDRDLADRDWAGQDRRCLRVPLAARLGRDRRQRLRCADRGARSARRDPRRGSPDDRRAPGVASRSRR